MSPSSDALPSKPLLPRSLRELLYGDATVNTREEELEAIALIDLAHISMLEKQKFLSSEIARSLSEEIRGLIRSAFQDVRGSQANRGTYILWEEALQRRLGPVGGSAHLFRSRNDLNASVSRLRLRRPVLRLLMEYSRLFRAMRKKAELWREVAGSAYTHFQPAQPTTMGHTVCGWLTALFRDVEGIMHSLGDLDICPLGAGAVTGTNQEIDCSFVAQKLGFTSVALNSLDAVASRDFALRILSACAISTVTLSRIASDMLLWSSLEYGFLRLPDELVGASSQMPQKRNPFLLEHVQSRASSCVGTFVSASTAMHSKPFTNSISVGTEGIRHVREAVDDLTSVCRILRYVFRGAELNFHKLEESLQRSPIAATEVANELAREYGLPFRDAYKQVASVVNPSNDDRGNEGGGEMASVVKELLMKVELRKLPLTQEFGGGPGRLSMGCQLSTLRERHTILNQFVQNHRRRYRRAYRELLN
jgi:argininosuccinate lyase